MTDRNQNELGYIGSRSHSKSLLLRGLDLLNLFPLFNRYTANTAAVFMLHTVLDEEEGPTGELTAARLAGYLEFLKKSSYNVISLSDYVSAIRNRKSTYKTVVFTFDDGYRNFYLNAYPLFRRYDYPATVFVTSDFIERRIFLWWDRIEFALMNTSLSEIDLSRRGLRKFPLTGDRERREAIEEIIEFCKRLEDSRRRELIESLVDSLEVDICGQPSGKYEPLSWDEILEMNRHGIEFFPHTKTHPIMSRVPYDQKLVELTESRQLLESKFNRELDIFCYPNGTPDDIDAESVRALEETGYRVAMTSIPGFNSTRGNNNLFMMHRLAIPQDALRFKQYVSGLEYLKDRFRRQLPLKPIR